MCGVDTSATETRPHGPMTPTGIEPGQTMRRRTCLSTSCGFRFLTVEMFLRPSRQPKPGTVMAEVAAEKKRARPRKTAAPSPSRRPRFGATRFDADAESLEVQDDDVVAHLRGRR
jgi:hypothetical protein